VDKHSNESGGFESLDEGWDTVETVPTSVPVNERYLARLVRMQRFERVGADPKLRLVFRIIRGPFKNCETTYFLSFTNRARAKGILAQVGLTGLPPSELLSFSEFDKLPAVFVTTVRSESRGRIYANVALIEAAPRRVEGGDESPPDPSGVAA
jgi:hypothetical protein